MRSLLLVVALALSAACSGGEDPEPAAPEPSRTELTVTGTSLVSPHQALAPLPGPVAAAARRTVQDVFEATVLVPLVDGRAGDVAALLTPDAASRATGADRPVLFDLGLPSVDRLDVGKANVRLTGLAGAAGNDPVLVVAKIDWDVAGADGGPRVQRKGELGMIPGGRHGWQVASYTITTTRTHDGATTTTTAVAR